jgi:glycosyltransferase involved in cell wall biosynthesis
VAPLRIGGGTRLKLVEALGMRTPVVSSFIGVQGLELADAEHLRLAHEPADFAQAVLQVLSDPAAAAAMARRGRDLVLERYTWKQLGKRLLEHWERIASDEL